MLHSLYIKLVLVLFFLFILIGGVFLTVVLLLLLWNLVRIVVLNVLRQDLVLV